MNQLEVVVRQATLADADAMGAMWLRAALTGYEGIFPAEAPKPTADGLTERWRRTIADDRTGAAVLVACLPGADATVVGSVAVAPDREDPTRAILRRLYVDPDHWAQGVGRRLHDAALDRLRRSGQDTVQLWVLEANTRARSMYERWGWRPTDARQAAYPGVDEILYLREL